MSSSLVMISISFELNRPFLNLVYSVFVDTFISFAMSSIDMSLSIIFDRINLVLTIRSPLSYKSCHVIRNIIN